MTDQLPPPAPLTPVEPAQANWWKRKLVGIPTWLIIMVVAFVGIGAIGAATKKDDGDAKQTVVAATTGDTTTETTASEPDETDPPTTPAPTTTERATTTTVDPIIPDGVYIVGVEIEPGLYRVGSYYSRQDANQDIIDNDFTISCPTLMIVESTDVYVEISGGALAMHDSLPYDPIANNCSDGRFLVGYNIQPGQYRVLPDNGSSYWARYDDSLEIIDNDLSEGQTILVIKDSDFAISISGTLEAIV